MRDLQIARFAATKQYRKAFAKLPAKKQVQVKRALEDALEDLHAPLLGLHGLTGQWLGVYSLNVGGDLRILFEAVDDGEERGSGWPDGEGRVGVCVFCRV